MSALTLQLLAPAHYTLDLSTLHPTALQGMPLRGLARLRLSVGRKPMALGDLFQISGNDYSSVRLLGLHRSCHRVGAGMRDGTLEIEGDVGDELGRELRGGTICAQGNAGAAVGSGMRGGQIIVRGNAGVGAGGVVPGATTGMNGGLIIIGRNAGDRAGERMRRGLLVIGRNAGSHVGSRMLAGTVAVLGSSGSNAGLGLRRGSVLLAQPPVTLAPTFNDCGEFELGMLTVLQRYLAIEHANLARKFARFARVRRWCGDMSYGGKGELLIGAGDR